MRIPSRSPGLFSHSPGKRSKPSHNRNKVGRTMIETTAIIKIRELHAGWKQTRICGPYTWKGSLPESWVKEYIATHPPELRVGKRDGVDNSPIEIFQRLAEKGGCPVQFDYEGEHFEFKG